MTYRERRALQRLETILIKMETWHIDFPDLDKGGFMESAKSELMRRLLPEVESK